MKTKTVLIVALQLFSLVSVASGYYAMADQEPVLMVSAVVFAFFTGYVSCGLVALSESALVEPWNGK